MAAGTVVRMKPRKIARNPDSIIERPIEISAMAARAVEISKEQSDMATRMFIEGQLDTQVRNVVLHKNEFYRWLVVDGQAFPPVSIIDLARMQ